MLLSMTMLASLIVFGSTPALAKTDFSGGAPSLVVNILNPDGTTTLVHEYQGVEEGSYVMGASTYYYYTYPELESLATTNYYATIDAMPAAVGTKAWGVTIDALVNDAKQYNPAIKWETGQKAAIYPTDDSDTPYQSKDFYNYDFVQGQARYYYPNLVEKYTAYRANGEDTFYLADWEANPVPMEPMLCLTSYQERFATDAILKSTENPVVMDSRESLRFCMGLTYDEARLGIFVDVQPGETKYSSTNKFCRWVYRIDIGPVSGPQLWADKTENEAGHPIDITFTDNAEWRGAITGITIDGNSIDPAHYTIYPGIISFDDTVFTGGSHVISVVADGYMNSQVTQTIKVSVTGVTLDMNEMTLATGGTGLLTATVSPAEATNKNLNWSSGNTDVATVDNSGLVTATGAGETVITVTTADGGFQAVCAVTVNPDIHTVTFQAEGATVYVEGVPVSSVTVEAGHDLVFTINPNEDYRIVSVFAGETELTPVESNYTLSNVTSDTTVVVNVQFKATLKAGSASGNPGDIVTIPVTMTSPGGIAGLQFDLSFDTSLLSYTDTLAGELVDNLDIETQNPVYTVVSHRLPAPDDNKVRVLVYSNTNTPIPAGRGVTADLRFTVTATVQDGQTAALGLSGAVMTGNTGASVTTETSGGQFEAGNPVTPVTVTRSLPAVVGRGQTFDVTVTFTSNNDNINSIGLSDFAPSGWAVQADNAWCTPDANESKITGNRTDYLWSDIFHTGDTFTAVYKVTVPAEAAPGLYAFGIGDGLTPHGQVEYYLDKDGPYVAFMTGNTRVEVIEGARIRGETRGASGEILSGVEVKIDGETPTFSLETGAYEVVTTTTGTKTILAGKAGYRSLTGTVDVTELTGSYTVDFKGDYGLVPDAPTLSYVLACINKWKFPPAELGLNVSKVLEVIHAWKYPNINNPEP